MAHKQELAVCIAGATGWTGRALVGGVLDAPDLSLRSAVSRSAAGRDLGEALGEEALGVPVYATAREALDGIDVLVDYTSVAAVKDNTLAAIEAGVSVVIGTSGLTASDFDDIEAEARERSVGVVASGNFSLTAAMCQAAALLAARHLPQWEVIDYASAANPTFPAGPLVSWPSDWARSAGRRLAIRSKSSTGLRRPAARTSRARRSTPCASRASSCPPRWSSACPTSA